MFFYIFFYICFNHPKKPGVQFPQVVLNHGDSIACDPLKRSRGDLLPAAKSLASGYAHLVAVDWSPVAHSWASPSRAGSPNRWAARDARGTSHKGGP